MEGSSGMSRLILFSSIGAFFWILSRNRSNQKSIAGPVKAQSDLVVCAVEAGGTAFKLALCKGSPANIVERHAIPTTTPAETLPLIFAWLAERKFDAIGVASFGPVDLNVDSPQYGFITTTPKAKWANTDLLGPLRRFGVPFTFDTDVNAPALAELALGQHCAKRSLCYVTIGTGVGVGVAIDCKPVHGLVHPEIGHIYVPRHADDMEFLGKCSFHGDCLEGLVCADALASRCGVTPAQLPSISMSDGVWDTFAFYVAHLCWTLTCSLSPETIVLGGGLMQRSELFPMIRAHFVRLGAGYIQHKLVAEDVDRYIVPPHFGYLAGTVGAAHLGFLALKQQTCQ